MRRLIATFLILLSGCSGVFLHPDSLRVSDPSQFGLKYEEIILSDQRGPNLVVWDIPPTAQYKATVLFLHGNAENISTHFRAITWMAEYGFRVVLFDYRGYGASHGEPSLEGVHRDAQRMFDYVASLEPNRKRRILYGQSLGATVALYTSSHQDAYCKEFAAIVADSAFGSYQQIAQEKLADFWLTYLFQLPLSSLVSFDYSPIRYVANLCSPVLYVHGLQDKIVLPHHSADLCTASKLQCTHWEEPTAGHIGFFASIKNRKRLMEWLNRFIE